MIKEYLPDSHALTADTGRIQHPDHTHMHKKLCLQGLVATEVPAEVSRVEDVYFFTDFNMIEISRLLDGSITTDVEVYYRVPWYQAHRRQALYKSDSGHRWPQPSRELAGGHGREKRPRKPRKVLEKGVPICQTRKIAQLQQQRMQVLRCQEFEPSFFACRVGGRGRENRPLSRSKVSRSCFVFRNTHHRFIFARPGSLRGPGHLRWIKVRACGSTLRRWRGAWSERGDVAKLTFYSHKHFQINHVFSVG